MMQKKALAVIKYIYMITLTGLLFIIFLFIFYNLSTTILNDKQLEQELIVYNILHDCSLDQTFGFYSRIELTQEHFKNCLEEFDLNKFTLRINFDILNSTYKPDGSRITYTLGKEENSFQREQQFCSIYSTKLCKKYYHSTLFLETNKELKNSIMYIEIIS